MSAVNKNCVLRMQEDRQTTKEEGSKEEDRQEGADARNVENEYVQDRSTRMIQRNVYLLGHKHTV